MGRPPRFDEESILDAALQLVARVGPGGFTMDDLARELGGNVGSLYYRFPSRDLLLARLWIRCARLGHGPLIEALSAEDLEGAFTDAVLHYPRWSRSNVAAAGVLAVHGREQLAARWPDELGEELATVNADLLDALRLFTKRWCGDDGRRSQRRMVMCLLDIPTGVIRRYLVTGRPPPRELDAAILAAARAAIAVPT